MKTALLLYCLASTAVAGIATLTWDPQPGCGFHVWHGVELMATVTTNEATFTLPDSGIADVRVTAFDPTGSYGESAPAEIRLVPIVTQKSTDLVTWEVSCVHYVELAAAMFFRVTPPTF